jgi:FkbM family methyltransferase
VSILDRHLGDDRLRLVDVGARGGVDHRWDRFSSLLEVTAFEPDPAECERLNRGADSLPYRARFLPHALWRESAHDVPFHVTNWPVASSLYRPNLEFLRGFPHAQGLLGVREVRSVEVMSLDDVARRENLAADCLKVDVEGAGLDVLVGGDATVKDALMLEVETEFNPLFESQPLFAEVDAHLRERGWSLIGLRRRSWRRGAHLDRRASGYGGQIVSADALYCNDAAVGQGLSFRRELKLLVILAAYLQVDAVLARIRSSNALGGRLGADELAELERVLAPRASAVRRLARRAFGRVGSARRRGVADRLQPGDATVWEDPHFF